MQEKFVVDTTQTSKTVYLTGIQRVVKNITENLSLNYKISKFYNNRLITNSSNTTLNVCTLHENYIDLKTIEKLVLLDSSWEYKFEAKNTISKLNKKCKIYSKQPADVVSD